MTSNVPVDLPRTAQGHHPTTHDPHGALRDGFPGRLVSGTCLLAAPLLALLGTGCGISSYHARGADFVGGMAAHPTLVNLGLQSALAAMVLFLIAVVGLSSLTTPAHPRLGRAAGVVTIIGLTGPIAFESLYWGAWHLTDTAGHRAAAAVMLDSSQVIPRSIMNVSGPALVIGFLLLAVAAFRAGVLDRARAVCLGATCLLPFGFISGYLAISLVGALGAAIALVPLGIRLLRGSTTH